MRKPKKTIKRRGLDVSIRRYKKSFDLYVPPKVTTYKSKITVDELIEILRMVGISVRDKALEDDPGYDVSDW